MKTLLSPVRSRVVLLGVLMLLVGLPTAAMSQTGPFSVARLVVCENVQDRSPVNVMEVFPEGMQTVFCFLEARDIPEATEVAMVWYFEEQEVARVPLSIGQGARWRTYTSKKTMGQKGNWKVYLQDSTDNTLASVQFDIE